MKAAILSKLESLTELARTLDAGLWAGRFGDPATAYAALTAVVAKAERCRGILARRYGEYHA